ncbi:MAG TPA: hypothetical protein VJQ47_04605 [Steroidobacteraceae bacterium]|nr:hypothetical protein [Steroidobacteraceae bacterium]
MSAYDGFRVGERVYCLAWIGKAFEIVAKDDGVGKISLRGDLECEPGGAQTDIFRSNIWMLSREPRDDIWSWPDRVGERYFEMFERFRNLHRAGDVVTGYLIEGTHPLEPLAATAERAMAFRIVAPIEHAIIVEPVVGLAGDSAEPIKVASTRNDIRWLSAGPVAAARIGMIAYRWSISFGDVVLNSSDFAGLS